eukprot:Gb_38416 [translate_table: standard]
MVTANRDKPFVDCLYGSSGESKLEMANAFTHFELDNSRREALIQPNVIGTLKSRQFSAMAILADFTMKHQASFLLNEDGTPVEAQKIVEAIMGILTLSSLPIGENAVKMLLVGIFSCIPSSDSNLNRFMTTENVLLSLLKMVSGQELELQMPKFGHVLPWTRILKAPKDKAENKLARNLLQPTSFTKEDVPSFGAFPARVHLAVSSQLVSLALKAKRRIKLLWPTLIPKSIESILFPQSGIPKARKRGFGEYRSIEFQLTTQLVSTWDLSTVFWPSNLYSITGSMRLAQLVDCFHLMDNIPLPVLHM